MFPVCPFCEEPVDPYEDGTYWEVSGWSPYRRSGGGFNSISLRSSPKSYAHEKCVRSQVKKSRSPESDTLF